MRDRSPTRKVAWFYDRWILVLSLALLGFGLLMVASTSLVISDQHYGYPFHYLIHQTFYIALGLAVAWGITRLPLKFWFDISQYLILVAIILLLVVLVPHIGKTVNGSRRWLNFGLMSLQVSEFAKLAMVLYMASYLQRYQQQVRTQLIGFIKPLLLLGVVAVLLLLEPDFGAVLVITATVFILLFIAGVRLWPLMLLAAIAAAMLIVLAITSPYRLARLTTFLHPWQNAYSSGYQLTQSLIAFGRGGIFGVGLGNSVQKLFYLPEAHTDFIFAVTAEELGMLGVFILLGLFVMLVWRVLKIGQLAWDKRSYYPAYLAFGIGFWITLQVIINVGVNTGLLPTKGLTLPFISYGGTSILVNCIVVGLMLRIAFETNLLAGNMPSSCVASNARRRRGR